MDASTIYEIVGIIGSALVLVSFLFKSPIWIRPINIVGCVILVVYGFLIGAMATWILNIGLCVVHIVYLSLYFYDSRKRKAKERKRPVHYEIVEGKEFAKIKNGELIGIKTGDVTVVAHYGDEVSAPVTFHVEAPEGGITLTSDVNQILAGQPVILKAKGVKRGQPITYRVISGDASIQGNTLVGKSAGVVSVVAVSGDITSAPIQVEVLDPESRISISSESTSLPVGSSLSLTYTLDQQ